jgi:hypothetical protein
VGDDTSRIDLTSPDPCSDGDAIDAGNNNSHEMVFRIARSPMKSFQANHKPGGESDRGLTMKERAKKARHAAYLLAKERKKNDPRLIELKEKLKLARREANAQAKERRKTDPVQIALKARNKKDRQDASKAAKEQRKERVSATKNAERADKETRIKSALGFASALPSELGACLPTETPSDPSDS